MEHKFEKRLNGIIEKYGCQAPELADGTLINSIVLDVFRRRCSGKKVAVTITVIVLFVVFSIVRFVIMCLQEKHVAEYTEKLKIIDDVK